MEEFSLLAILDLLAWRRATTVKDEGAELFVREDGCGHGVVALRAERLTDDARLAPILRHELAHVRDTLDPAFGYSPHLRLSGPVPTPQRLVRERYRLLWALTIDGRHEPVFHRAYSFWPEPKRQEVFDRLWSDHAPRHADLLALASDPRNLQHAREPLAGEPCPMPPASDTRPRLCFDHADGLRMGLPGGTVPCYRCRVPNLPAPVWMLAWVLGLLSVHAAECCTVPVFRYGLDNWQADAFRLEVPASALTDPKLADFFRNLGTAQPANLEVRTGSSTEARLLFPHPEEAKSPVLWTGALTPASLAALIDSPARKEIARRVLGGESVVWVLAESGNKAEDDAIAARVEKRLRYLEQVAILPRIDPNDPTSKLGPGPALRVKFSLLRVARGGASDETLLLKMLAGPKPATELQTGAWLAAVFGRGRVLGAWSAEDFGDAEIEEASLFLLGACSCQVKRQNPGWDMLMNVNWTEELRAAAEKAQSPQAEPAGRTNSKVQTGSASEPEVVLVSGGAKLGDPVDSVSQPKPFLWLGAGACAVIGLFLFIRQR